MEATEQPTEVLVPAKKKRKPPVRRKRATAAKAEPVPAEFAGITATDCCEACKPDKCAITGVGICGHPLKGGLQPLFQTQPEVVARYSRAQRVLRHARLDLIKA